MNDDVTWADANLAEIDRLRTLLTVEEWRVNAIRQHYHARARRWKRAAKHNRRKAAWWTKQYFTLREAHVELRGVADRRRQQAAWFARQLAAERSRRRDIVTKLITTYMAVLSHREYVSPEQALAVLEQEWRALVIRAETSARGSETSEGES